MPTPTIGRVLGSALGVLAVVVAAGGVALAPGQSAAASRPQAIGSTGHSSGPVCSGFLPLGSVVGIAPTPDDGGYWVASSFGQVVSCGNAANHGSLVAAPMHPVVDIVTTPDGGGYWLVGSDGGVFTFGDAGFFGSTGNLRLNQPVEGMAATPDGRGYWLAAADGGVFTFGDARFFGSTGALHLNAPVLAMAAAPDGNGYWLAAADGGVFAFNVPFLGSMGAVRLNRPVVGMAVDRSTGGYWLVGTDGGIFSFNAPFFGSTGGTRLNLPVVGMEAVPSGYRLVASDGGVFTFGSSQFFGSAVSPLPLGVCVVTMSNPNPTGGTETATIRSTVPNAPVIVTLNFKYRVDSFGGATDGSGNAVIAFALAHPAIGFPVGVDVNVGEGTATCATSFTPR